MLKHGKCPLSLPSQITAWPISVKNCLQFALPHQFSHFGRVYEDFYSTRFNGRNLRWALSHCTAELRLLYADRPYTLQLSALNAATLLLFDTDDVDAMSVRRLAEGLLPDPVALEAASSEEQQQQPVDEDAARKAKLKREREKEQQQTLTRADKEEILRRAVMPLVEACFVRLEGPDGNLVGPTSLFAVSEFGKFIL